jgi:hypothetical protein
MKNILRVIIFFAATLPLGRQGALQAGNPDRQGEAGAYELLMNPWARSAGLHTMSTSFVRGVESMRLNVAGLSRINRLEAVASYADYLRGADIQMNAFGVATRVGKSGALGLSIMALNFGEIRITTTDLPEGSGATFSPNFFNIGLGYAYTFENKISVGILARVVSETISNLSAFGLALDVGIQYVTGEQENFKFGISLRNIGTPMRYSGEGLATQVGAPRGNYELTYDQRAASFELPSMLNIGASYDIYAGDFNRITLLGNFTSHSFSRDQIGGGIEYSLKEVFSLRGAYRFDIDVQNAAEAPIYSGLSFGASIEAPFSRASKNTRLGFDYAYRATRVWGGTHNFSVRIGI